jgi:hypothetical protein
MTEIEIKGENGYLKIQIQKMFGFPESTSPFGGYDTESIIEIKSSNYYIKGLIWITTGDLYSFYKELKNCQEKVKGQANLNSYENNLHSTITYDEFGHAVLRGKFTEKYEEENTLEFELKSDQSYLNSTISELERMIEKYGDNTGIKNK